MDKKFKEGMSIQELEKFSKKYQHQIFIIIYLVLATLMTFLFFSPGLSIFLTGIGGILGAIMPVKIDKAIGACYHFVMKQEKKTQLILGIVGAVVAFFLPPLVFFFLGLAGGKSFGPTHSHPSHHENHDDNQPPQ